MTKTALKQIKKVTINDYRGYKEDTCRNGGDYGFWQTYHNNGNGTWDIVFHTTSDLEFCEVCGMFGEHPDCEEYSTVTDDELLSEINNFETTDKEWIDFD